MQKYDPHKIEKKWQKHWEKEKTFEVKEDADKSKFYSLIEFPYPSGAGLHVGHPRPFTAMDVISRKKRMEGFNVLYPIGFDAFGLPTENYAIKTGRPPAEVTAENIANFTRQLKSLGYSFDWSRQVDTTDPKYYKWTQWLFLQFFKHGLAYKKNQPINWCPKDKIGLANEEVIQGCCERCGTPVEQRNKEQWMLAITKYADKLLEGLKEVDYIPQARIQQENWIGRSEGAEVKFFVRGQSKDHAITVFTTRPDTIFGVSYVAVSPELAKSWIGMGWKPEKNVVDYIEKTLKERAAATDRAEAEKTGVAAGFSAVNPANDQEVPVWITNYVMGGVGTGAIMGVPAHDERDYEFALTVIASETRDPADKFIKNVVKPKDTKDIRHLLGFLREGEDEKEKLNELLELILASKRCFPEEGIAVNSEFLNGLLTSEAKEKMIVWLEEKEMGKRQVNYKLRDWVFSRQRYWGEPIPLVFCENCKNEKHHYVILHGFSSHAESGWKPWLKQQLEAQGHTVFCPTLPHSAEPNVDEQVDYVLANTTIDENTVIIGHSLGGTVLLKLLEKIKSKIAKAILVDTVIRPEYVDDDYPLVTKSCDWQFDFKKIKSRANEFVVLADKNFPVIPEVQSRDLTTFLDASLQLVQPVNPHFSHSAAEPEVWRVLEQTGWIPLPESELPLELPKVKKYEPTDTGESPLAAMTDWVKTKCPRCGGEAKRETDTMPNWAGSSWYFLRYCDPENKKEFASPEKLKYWMSVDWYNGGMEHTVLHLLYSRFWNQFLYDIGLVPTKEPYKKRTSHGLILGPDGEKMSKSRGNVVNPDEMIEQFGTDAFRMYIMFMGPFDQHVQWDTNGLVGVRRFLERVWVLRERVIASEAKQSPGRSAHSVASVGSESGGIATSPSAPRNDRLTTVLHQTIKKVTENIDAMRFNTAVAALMELVNEMMKNEVISSDSYAMLLKLLSPFAPHIAEELWQEYGDGGVVAYTSWPQYNAELAKESSIILPVQINGKVRDQIEVSPDISEDEVKKLVIASEKVQKWLEGKEPKKVIYVTNKLVSIVI